MRGLAKIAYHVKRMVGMDDELRVLREKRLAIQAEMEREMDRVRLILDEADARHADHDR